MVEWLYRIRDSACEQMHHFHIGGLYFLQRIAFIVVVKFKSHIEFDIIFHTYIRNFFQQDTKLSDGVDRFRFLCLDQIKNGPAVCDDAEIVIAPDAAADLLFPGIEQLVRQCTCMAPEFDG